MSFREASQLPAAKCGDTAESSVAIATDPLAMERSAVKARRAACWICGSARIRRFKNVSPRRPLVPEDFLITDSDYGVTLGLVQCTECGFVFAEGEDLQHLVTLYEALEDPAYEDTQDARAHQMRWLLRRARRLHPGAKTVLDIGAGAGRLVAEARRAGYEAVGVEPIRALVESARRINHIDLLQGVYPHPQLEGTCFDLVFLVDVIEHVADPVELIKACRGALSPGGILIAVTPDIGSLTARVLGRRWWHFRLAHVGYFSTRSMLCMTQRCGLRVIHRCRPVWFFRAGYLADRLQRYVPIGWMNKLAGRMGFMRRILNMVVAVNPRDSMLVALCRVEE